VFDRGLYGEPVNDDVDGVLVLLVKDGRIGELDDLSVNASPAEALRCKLPEDLDVLPLAAADYGSQHLESCPLLQRHEPVDDLLR
jgi:hypothetical protein